MCRFLGQLNKQIKYVYVYAPDSFLLGSFCCVGQTIHIFPQLLRQGYSPALNTPPLELYILETVNFN